MFLYMAMGNLLFGPSAVEFSTLFNTFNALFLMSIGGFEYTSLGELHTGEEDVILALLGIISVHYEAPQTSVSGRDSQTMTVNFIGLYDETETEMVKITFSSEDTKLKGAGAVDIDSLSS